MLHREKARRGGGGLHSVQTQKALPHASRPVPGFLLLPLCVCMCGYVCAHAQNKTGSFFPLQVCDEPTLCKPPDPPPPPCRAPRRPRPHSQVPAACPLRLSLSWDPGISCPCFQSPPGFLQSHSHHQTLSSAKILTMSNPPGGEDGHK